MLNPKLSHHLAVAHAVPSTRSAGPNLASFAWHLRIYQGLAAGETPVNETQRPSSQEACGQQKSNQEITGGMMGTEAMRRQGGEVQAWPPGRVGAHQVDTWRGSRHSVGEHGTDCAKAWSGQVRTWGFQEIGSC